MSKGNFGQGVGEGETDRECLLACICFSAFPILLLTMFACWRRSWMGPVFCMSTECWPATMKMCARTCLFWARPFLGECFQYVRLSVCLTCCLPILLSDDYGVLPVCLSVCLSVLLVVCLSCHLMILCVSDFFLCVCVCVCVCVCLLDCPDLSDNWAGCQNFVIFRSVLQIFLWPFIRKSWSIVLFCTLPESYHDWRCRCDQCWLMMKSCWLWEQWSGCCVWWCRC